MRKFLRGFGIFAMGVAFVPAALTIILIADDYASRAKHNKIVE